MERVAIRCPTGGLADDEGGDRREWPSIFGVTMVLLSRSSVKALVGSEPQKSPEYLGDRELLGRETNCSTVGPGL